MISLVLGYHDVDVGSAPQLTMPVSVDQFGSYTYQGGSYGDIEFPSEPQDHNAVDQFLGLKSGSEDTYSGGALPAPSSVTVSVLNGSGAYNQATTTSQSLQALGFHIETIGDSPPVGQEAETVVYYTGEGGLAGHRRHRHGLLGQRSAGHHHDRPRRWDHAEQHHDNDRQQRQHREFRCLPGADPHGRVAPTLGPSFLHRQWGRRALTTAGP
jgi:hypothetical protein